MKVQRIRPTVPSIKGPTAKPGSLSNDAFYLIVLALLLKKESGSSSLLHYLMPPGLSLHNEKSAA